MPFALSALSDEIAPELEAALRVLAEEGIPSVELRTVFGKNVLELTDAEADRCRAMVQAAGLGVSGVASPVGKSELGRPAGYEEGRLARALELARRLGTSRVRVFSFYPDPGTEPEAALEEAVRRIRAWVRRAEAAGVLLLLENEVGLVGDVPARCGRILEEVGSPHLRFAWDPANFVRSGVARPFAAGWALLGSYVACAHVKDCRADGTHTPAGQGDGQWPELLAALGARGGVPLVLEPHLEVAGHSTGFTGPQRFREAVAALRALLPAA
jgi:sugar phosphate isomerase/epimerase